MPEPIFGEERGFRIWDKSEIYTPAGPGRMVPNVNDVVTEWSGNVLQFNRVSQVNETDGTSQLVPATVQPPSGGVLEEDILLGSGPGTVSESYRLYTNTETVPHSLVFDSRLHIYGATAQYVKVFRGTDISEDGHVISAVFNVANQVVSQNIPLQNVIIPGSQVIAIRTPVPAGAIEALTDGEVCTVVVYGTGGEVLSYYKLLTRVTNFIRTTDSSLKYIVDIDLISNLISSSNASLVEVPLNFLLQSANFMGKVTYSDGSELVLPVDGTKFRLSGIDNFVASQEGQQAPLVLFYYMSANEFAYGDSGPTGARFKSEDYTITTIAAQGAYSVKLFAVPRWQTTPSARWVLDWYLYNLDRDEVFDATPYVQYAVLSTPFNGTAIGTRQQLTVTVNLQQVSPTFNYFQHVQILWVTLTQLGNNNAVNGYTSIEYTDGNVYGATFEAVRGVSATPTEYTLNVANGLTDIGDWLAATYYKVEPIIMTGTELVPPAPTHFRLRIGASFTREVEVIAFASLIDNIPNSAGATQGAPARLEFFRRVGLTDYELAVAHMTIQVP